MVARFVLWWNRCELCFCEDIIEEVWRRVEELFIRLFAIVFAAGLVHWYREVNKADISPFKASLFYFAVAMAFIFVMLWYTSETIKIFSALFASYQIFVGAVHLITNDSEKYQREASVWVEGMLGLMAITGVLMLAIDYSNTKPLLNPMLIGFAGGWVPGLFKRWSGKGNRKENL